MDWGEDAEAPGSARGIMSKRILLIEYEPRYLDRIRGFLEGKDYELVIARDGEEGLDAFRRSKPDLVLVSSVLPKLRTPDVIKGILDLGTPPPILLMMAGYRGKNRVADARRVGATSILEKPFTEEVFLAELEAFSRGGLPGPVPSRCRRSSRPTTSSRTSSPGWASG